MKYIGTITSKRQLTIPVDAFRQLNLAAGEKVVISVQDRTMFIQKAVDLVEQLAGFVSVPKGMAGADLDKKAVKEALLRYFEKGGKI